MQEPADSRRSKSDGTLGQSAGWTFEIESYMQVECRIKIQPECLCVHTVLSPNFFSRILDRVEWLHHVPLCGYSHPVFHVQLGVGRVFMVKLICLLNWQRDDCLQILLKCI